MATTPRNTLYSWFLTGLKPLQAQFAAWIDSFWHKDDVIPVASIEGLQDLLDGKPDTASLTHTLFLNGNPFLLVKNPDNNDTGKRATLEINDYVKNGAWAADEIWDLAIALGTDKDNRANWNVIKSTKEIPQL